MQVSIVIRGKQARGVGWECGMSLAKKNERVNSVHILFWNASRESCQQDRDGQHGTLYVVEGVVGLDVRNENAGLVRSLSWDGSPVLLARMRAAPSPVLSWNASSVLV